MNADIGIDAPGLAQNQPPAPRAPTRPRRWWPWVLLVVGLGLILMLVLAAALASWLLTVLQPGLDGVQIDIGQLGVHGEALLRKLSAALTAMAEALQQAWPWLATLDWHLRFDDLTFGGLTLGLLVFLVGAVLVVLVVLALLTLLPMLVVAVLAGGVLALLAALLLVAATVALALLPLWLPALGLVWWWSRRQRPELLAASASLSASASPSASPTAGGPAPSTASTTGAATS